MTELQTTIDNIFKEHSKRFQITRLKNLIIIRVLSKRYQYIHVKQSGIIYTMQLFELDLNTGEKTPISSEITGTLSVVLTQMKPTLSCW
jgi:hypothetical protein